MSKAKSALSKTIWVGLDVHRDSITSAVLVPGRETPVVDRWFHDEPSVRRIVGTLGEPCLVRLCYEAGPTGYDLARLLGHMGVAAEVIAPSLIPVAPGAKIKTDPARRPAPRTRYRAGELTAVHIPTPGEEAIRDLARTRGDLVIDRTRCRHRLSKFLLRHGQVYRGGVAWTLAHETWLRQLHFADAALMSTYSHYRAIVAGLDAHLAAVESDLKGYLEQGPFAEAVSRLSAYRGVSELGALSLSAEVCDWRRFPRATSLMGFCGLVPSEYSSGERTVRAASPSRATCTCAPSWLSRPGPTSTVPRWGPPSRSAKSAPATTRSPGPGPPSPPLRQVPSPGRAQKLAQGGGHRRRPRARRVPLGRDGRVR